MPRVDSYVAKKIGMSNSDFSDALEKYKCTLVTRGEIEIEYWNDCIAQIKKYTRDEAIEELIRAKKLHEKISVINAYIEKLKK